MVCSDFEYVSECRWQCIDELAIKWGQWRMDVRMILRQIGPA